MSSRDIKSSLISFSMQINTGAYRYIKLIYWVFLVFVCFCFFIMILIKVLISCFKLYVLSGSVCNVLVFMIRTDVRKARKMGVSCSPFWTQYKIWSRGSARRSHWKIKSTGTSSAKGCLRRRRNKSSPNTNKWFLC